jgi:hypothetical protein
MNYEYEWKIFLHSKSPSDKVTVTEDIPVVVGCSLRGGLAPPATVVVVGIGGHQAAVGYLVDLDELVQGVIGVIEAAVAGHVAVPIVGETGIRNFVAAVIGEFHVPFGQEVAGGIICVILLNTVVYP